VVTMTLSEEEDKEEEEKQWRKCISKSWES
jgi:hypothetical protein